jgi:putative transposase
VILRSLPRGTGLYAAFVIDVFARRILGWRASRTMHIELVLDALEQALHCREVEKGLPHHSVNA